MTYQVLGLIGIVLLFVLWLGRQAREVQRDLGRLLDAAGEAGALGVRPEQPPCGYWSYRWDVPHAATRVVVIDTEWRERQRYLVHWN